MLILSHQGSGPASLFEVHTPFAICGPPDSEANGHAPNESMSIIDLKYSTAFVAALATEFGQIKSFQIK